MGSKICMNGLCGATTSPEWKRGWELKSGGYSTLCYNCGTAYDNVVYCERFHLNESGWRECQYCEKPIHCGCIVSKCLHDYLDLGGIACILCLRAMANHSIRPVQSPSDDVRNGFGSLTPLNSWQSTAVGSRISGVSPDKGKPVHLTEAVVIHQPVPSTPSHKIDPTLSFDHVKREGKVLPAWEVGTSFSSTEVHAPFPPVSQKSIPPSIFVKPDNSRPALGLNDMYNSIVQASLNFSLGGPQVTSNSVLPNPGGAIESSDTDKVPPFKQGQRTRHILPKPPKPGPNVQSQANRGTPSQIRVARPPGEGRGRNQLLPRYWPRITDQELEQISGDLNSNIVPLFEKILSASDAGRIGRLVLPKACAEAYFPPISNSEGLPIRIQDIKGKEWTFQFRFWPNNNSRMYVLEGVTPCIQNMQLQAGDTVTFSRIDPGGKLVMGCRKATTPVDMQEGETSDRPNDRSGEASHKGATEVPPTKKEDYEGINGDSTQRHVRVTEKKRSHNIGLKSKRLHMHREDAMELRVTWEEAQELFRPPPGAKPNIVMVENYEFEEYDEPPIFGKRTIFTARASGEQEQWGQCDNCSKWRRLPLDILLPPRWTCSDNSWDPNRCSCSAPDELNTRELERLHRVSKDFKRRRITEKRIAEAVEPTGLDALAFAAVLGDGAGDLDEPSLGATTRHPRHRPGCTCIVCIQPPSGKGKHKPTCICNVCLTVKRRFKTLMLRKKKRLLERESEIARGKDGCIPLPPKEKLEVAGSPASTMIPMTHQLENERDWNGMEIEVGESSKGQQLDLNCDPNREEELMLAEAERMSLTSLVNATTLPLEMYLGHNGLPSMVPCLLSRAASETNEYPPDDNGCFSPVVELDHESKADEG